MRGAEANLEVVEYDNGAMLFPALPVRFNADKIRAAMRLHPGSKDAAAFENLVEQARIRGRPKAVYRPARVTAVDEDDVVIEGFTLPSPLLHRQLAHVRRVFPFIVTCGAELDALEPPPKELLQRYYWSEITTAVMRSAHQAMRAHLLLRFRIPRVSRLSPGSGAAWLWPVEQQVALFRLLGDTPERIGVHLLESGLMVPTKTVSGLHYASKTTFQTCRACRIEDCPDRLAPFDPDLWEELRHGQA